MYGANVSIWRERGLELGYARPEIRFLGKLQKCDLAWITKSSLQLNITASPMLRRGTDVQFHGSYNANNFPSDS